VQVVEGLIFICLAEEPPPFATFAQDMAHFFGPHRLSEAKIAYRKTYISQANWKIVAENAGECYHCSPVHPEYCSVMSFVNAQDSPRLAQEQADFEASWRESTARLGHRTGMRNRRPEGDLHVIERLPIRRGFRTQSEDGRPVAPLMGNFKQYDGGLTRVMRYPCILITANNDHAMLARFTPLGPQQTEWDFTWLVHPDAVQGVDYDPLAVSWLIRTTAEQDIGICGQTHAGITSRRYRPGPYSAAEVEASDFADWYLRELPA
jgi:phenylpropionate dioxygenase-like ring-hydroxylating dioxygenase large terminal subunit